MFSFFSFQSDLVQLLLWRLTCFVFFFQIQMSFHFILRVHDAHQVFMTVSELETLNRWACDHDSNQR